MVIPAKNEARNLPAVLGALPAGLHEVILVDGNSTDDTVAVARACCPGIVVIQQSRKGKGNALACGFAAATGDFLVMLDADGSTDPEEIPRFVAALEQGADFAKGSRFMPGAGSSDISRLRQAGNFWLSTIVNLLYGTRYTDLCYGYNAFRRDCLQEIDLDASARTDVDPTVMLWGDGFEVETLINVRIAKAGLRVLEVPSFESRRVFAPDDPHRAPMGCPEGCRRQQDGVPARRCLLVDPLDVHPRGQLRPRWPGPCRTRWCASGRACRRTRPRRRGGGCSSPTPSGAWCSIRRDRASGAGCSGHASTSSR